MQRFTTRLALAALVALALSTPRLAAAGGYTITDLGTRPGYVNSWTWQQSINNDGVVAAYANNTNPADPNAFVGDISFLWKNGTITPLARTVRRDRYRRLLPQQQWAGGRQVDTHGRV
jgi:hypothetical protein